MKQAKKFFNKKGEFRRAGLGALIWETLHLTSLIGSDCHGSQQQCTVFSVRLKSQIDSLI
ncbi:hypothetical protein CUC08_Gglean004356 [Alternaria sp. MG1]|nr:hypothetical protein CUC08_Gglean004356 [Alternaria sp. MG1]